MKKPIRLEDPLLQFMRPLTSGKKIVLDPKVAQVVRAVVKPKKDIKPGLRTTSNRAASGSRRNKRLKFVGTRKSDRWSAPEFDHGLKPDHQARALAGGVEGIRDTFLKAIQPISPKGHTHEHHEH